MNYTQKKKKKICFSLNLEFNILKNFKILLKMEWNTKLYEIIFFISSEAFQVLETRKVLTLSILQIEI